MKSSSTKSIAIRPFNPADSQAVGDLSVRAWEPFFASFKKLVGPTLDKLLHPAGVEAQRKLSEETCRDSKYSTWVAEVDSQVAGFICLTFDRKEKIGEVYLLAVDPMFSGKGVGASLNNFALQEMREAGMRVAKVGTGGDPSHEPARRSYEKAGYVPVPVVHYFQDLTQNSGSPNRNR